VSRGRPSVEPIVIASHSRTPSRVFPAASRTAAWTREKTGPIGSCAAMLCSTSALRRPC